MLLEGLHPAPPLRVSCSSPAPSQPCSLSHFDLSPAAIKRLCLLPLQRVSVLDVQCSRTSGGTAHFLRVFPNTSGTLVLNDASKIFEDPGWYARTITASGFFPFTAQALQFCLWVSQMVATISSSQSLLNRSQFIFLVHLA